VDWSTTRQANSGPGSLTGVEVYFDSDLPFLPEAFHGLHLHGNFTIFDSEVTLLLRERAGETVPLFSQPDWVGNVSVSYERKGFLARVSANYQGCRLANVASGDSLIEELESRTGSRTGLDLYEEGRFRLDLFFQYTWRDSLTLFAEVTNVTNEPVERTYGEDGYLTASLQYTEPVYFIGLQWKL